MRKALIMLLAGALVPLAGCGGNDREGERTAVEPQAVSTEAAVGKTVRLTATGPVPKLLIAASGETITWRNETSAQVRMLLVDGTKPAGPIPPGGTFSHLFDTAGMFAYWLGGKKKEQPDGVVEINPPATPAP